MLRYFAAMRVPGAFVFHVPNEGKRSGRSGNRMKREGMMPGVADLVFNLPAEPGQITGRVFYMELKRLKGGRLSKKQEGFRDLCRMAGIAWAEIRTLDAAVEQLHAWGLLRGPRADDAPLRTRHVDLVA